MILVDTHLLIWAAIGSPRLSEAARAAIEFPAPPPFFSAVSIWEVAVKSALDRPDFRIDARRLRRELLASDYRELDVTSAHGILTRLMETITDRTAEVLEHAEVKGDNLLQQIFLPDEAARKRRNWPTVTSCRSM